MIEPRRTGKCGKGSGLPLGGGKFEYSEVLPAFQSLQAAFILSRFTVSDAVARCLAEHAFSRRPQR